MAQKHSVQTLGRSRTSQLSKRHFNFIQPYTIFELVYLLVNKGVYCG